MKLSRRKRALVKLEATLKSGVKVSKDGTERLSLTDSDKRRINKEVESLKLKIK